MIAPTKSCEIGAPMKELDIIGITASSRGIQSSNPNILDQLIVNVRKQKIQINSSNDFAVFTILAPNGVSLIQTLTIWTSQDAQLAENKVPKLYFLLTNRRPSQIKIRIVNGQFLLNVFALLAALFHLSLLSKASMFSKIYVIYSVILAPNWLSVIMAGPLMNSV